MAQRRMFSVKIINSARFLKMPSSSQLLYFHLGLHADDDGVVEGYNVMRMIGCSEDDLKILSAKGFVIVLNEDLVSYLTDWTEHNLIRSDRKIDSIYKDLLIQVVSSAKLIESRLRADSKHKEIEPIGQPMDDQWTSDGQPMDNQWPVNGQHRLGKVRLGKVRLGQVRLENTLPEKTKVSKPKIEKIAFMDEVTLLDSEYQKLVSEYGELGVNRIIEILNNYKLANGKKYKSDYGAINSWVKERYEQERQKKGMAPKAVQPEIKNQGYRNADELFEED